MLSALIPSGSSYPTLPVVRQLAHQGSVPLGPLVKLFPDFSGLRLYLLPALHLYYKMINGRSAYYPDTNIGIVPPLWRNQSLQGQTKF